MIGDELQELDDLIERAEAGRRALKVAQGQLRCAIQVQADLLDRMRSLRRRLDPTAEEAQHGEEEDTAEARRARVRAVA